MRGVDLVASAADSFKGPIYFCYLCTGNRRPKNMNLPSKKEKKNARRNVKIYIFLSRIKAPDFLFFLFFIGHIKNESQASQPNDKRLFLIDDFFFFCITVHPVVIFLAFFFGLTIINFQPFCFTLTRFCCRQAALRKMLARQPSLLAVSLTGDVMKKTHFFAQEMGMGSDQIAKMYSSHPQASPGPNQHTLSIFMRYIWHNISFIDGSFEVFTHRWTRTGYRYCTRFAFFFLVGGIKPSAV